MSAVLPEITVSETIQGHQSEYDGEWGFVWGNFLTADELESYLQTHDFEHLPKPCLWNELPAAYPAFGYGTYFTYLRIPDSLRNQQIGVYIPKCHSACVSYIGNQKLTEAGKPATSKDDYRPAFLPRKGYFVATDSLVPLIIHVANYDYAVGGIFEPVYIGSGEVIEQLLVSHLAGPFGIALALFIASLFYTGIFAFIKKDRALLYFGLFCLAQSTRILFSDEYPYAAFFSNLDWNIVVRLEFASLILTIVFFSQLVHALFPNQANRKIIRFFQVLCAIYLLLVVATSPFLFSSLNKPFVLSMAPLALYGCWVFVRAFMKGETGSRLALISLSILLGLFLLQLLKYLRFLSYDPLLTHAFFIGFILTQSLLLSQRVGEYIKDLGRKAMESAEVKTNFLTAISHELRTPMNGVIGMTGLLEKTELTLEQKRYVQAIRHSSENLMVLLDDLLDFTLLTRRKIVLERVEFRLDKAVEDVIMLFAEKARAKDLLVHVRIMPGTPRKVIGDVSRFKQILANLLSNAIKYTDRGEVLIVIEKKDQKKNGLPVFQIQVTDTGHGIREEIKDQIFEAFVQGKNGLTRKFEGTGIGLAITHKIVDAMSGHISFSSQVGSGTTFTVTLPFEVRQIEGTGLPCCRGQKAVIFSKNPSLIKSLELELQQLGVEILSQVPDQPGDAIIFVGEAWSIQHEQQVRQWAEQGHSLVQWSYGTRRSRLITQHLVNPLTPGSIRAFFKNALEKQKKKTHTTQTHDPIDLSRLSVLVAEDNPVNLQLAVMLLRKLGIQPDTATNGLEVLKATETKNYDIILMDLQMPTMDGLTATIRLRQNDSIDPQPVIIALTANALPEDEERCRKAGMEDFLAKPIRPGVLEEKLKQWGHIITTRNRRKDNTTNPAAAS